MFAGGEDIDCTKRVKGVVTIGDVNGDGQMDRILRDSSAPGDLQVEIKIGDEFVLLSRSESLLSSGGRYFPLVGVINHLFPNPATLQKMSSIPSRCNNTQLCHVGDVLLLTDGSAAKIYDFGYAIAEKAGTVAMSSFLLYYGFDPDGTAVTGSVDHNQFVQPLHDPASWNRIIAEAGRKVEEGLQGYTFRNKTLIKSAIEEVILSVDPKLRPLLRHELHYRYVMEGAYQMPLALFAGAD